jgi:hypothetical protein
MRALPLARPNETLSVRLIGSEPLAEIVPSVRFRDGEAVAAAEDQAAA